MKNDKLANVSGIISLGGFIVLLLWNPLASAAWFIALAGGVMTVILLPNHSVLTDKIALLKAGDADNIRQEIDIQQLEKKKQLVEGALYASLLLFVIFFALAFFVDYHPGAKEVIVDQNDFHKARIEWFLALTFAFGVVAAVWAVWAKLVADKAFEEAAVAANQSLKAYHAVSTKSFDFTTFIGDELLLKHIGSAQKSLRLLLGIPAVGYFRKKDGIFPLNRAALDISNKIIAKAREISENGGTVDVICLDLDLCLDIAKRTRDDGMPEEMYLDFGPQMKAFWGAMRNVVTKSKDKSNFIGYRLSAQREKVPLDEQGTVECKDEPVGNSLGFDAGLRIAVVDKSLTRGVSSEEAYVWFVADFQDEEPADFKASALKTDDPQILSLLKSLIEYYKNRLLKSPVRIGAPNPTAAPVVDETPRRQNGN